MSHVDDAWEALAEWRLAQHRMDVRHPDDPLGGWQQAYIDAELAKGAYMQAIDDAKREHRAQPPAFEKATAGAERADGETEKPR